ncbi:MAG: hypothetical protein ACOYON_13685 [Fimbriimonas sp.]
MKDMGFIFWLKIVAGVIGLVFVVLVARVESRQTKKKADEGEKEAPPRIFSVKGWLTVLSVMIAFALSTWQEVVTAKDQAIKDEAQGEKEKELKEQQEKLDATLTAILNESKNLVKGVEEVKGTATVIKGDVERANEKLIGTISSLKGVARGQKQSLDKLDVTAFNVRRGSKPFRPTGMTALFRFTGKESQEFGREAVRLAVELERDWQERIRRAAPRERNAVVQSQDKSWALTPQRLLIYQPSKITEIDAAAPNLIRFGLFSEALLVELSGVSGTPPLPRSVALKGDAPFAVVDSTARTGNRLISTGLRSHLVISIDRKTFEIEKRMYVEEIKLIGAAYGIESLLDLPGLDLNITMLGLENSTDVEITRFELNNDTYITGGKFPERLLFIGEPAPQESSAKKKGWQHRVSEADLGRAQGQ